MSRGQIDRVVGRNPSLTLLGDVVPSETIAEESACDIQEVRIQPTENDPSKRPGLFPAERGAIGLDHQSLAKDRH